MSFKNRLKSLRLEKGLNQRELAEALKVSPSSISMYETGNREPDFETLEMFCNFFNVDIEYMLGKSYKTTKNIDTQPKGYKIPVLGEVAAGVPIEAVEDIIDYEEIPIEWKSKGDFFALQIKGDSMQPKMDSGDVVIVRKQSDADSGDTVIVVVNGDSATCKKIKKQSNGLMLIPTNPNYETIFYSKEDIESLPVTIIGKVVELRAKF